MGHLDTIQRVQMMPALAAIYQEYVVDKTLISEFNSLIDAHGLVGERVLVLITAHNRTHRVRPGIYQKLKALDLAVNRAAPLLQQKAKEQQAGAAASPSSAGGPPPRPPQVQRPVAPDRPVSGVAPLSVSIPAAAGSPPPPLPVDPVPAPAPLQQQGPPSAQAAQTPPAAASETAPKAKRRGRRPSDTPRKLSRQVVRGVAQRASVLTGAPAPLEQFLRPGCQGYTIARYWRESPRTFTSMAILASEGKFTMKRLLSAFHSFRSPSDPWYLPRYGWQLIECPADSASGEVPYQIVPAEQVSQPSSLEG